MEEWELCWFPRSMPGSSSVPDLTVTGARFNMVSDLSFWKAISSSPQFQTHIKVQINLSWKKGRIKIRKTPIPCDASVTIYSKFVILFVYVGLHCTKKQSPLQRFTTNNHRSCWYVMWHFLKKKCICYYLVVDHWTSDSEFGHQLALLLENDPTIFP
jgi:hypothetical protein